MGPARLLPSTALVLAMVCCNSLAGLDDLQFSGTGGTGQGGTADGGAATGSAGGPGVGGSSTSSGGGTGGDSAGGGGSGALSYAEVVLSDGPIAYWRLDDTGPLVTDVTNNDHDGVFAGNVTAGAPGLIKGDPNLAMELDGLGASIDMGDVLDFPSNAPYSLEAWVMPLSFPDSFEAGICSKRTADGTRGYSLRILSAPVMGSAGASHFLDGVIDGAEGMTPLALGDIFHIVSVYDGSAIRLYRNGVEDAADTTGIPTLTDNDGSFIIGVDDGSQFLHGVVDEVAVYDYALTAIQVAQHYLAGSR